MNYLDIYDFIEQLMKYRVINKRIISLLNIEHKFKVTSLIEWCRDKGVIEELDEQIKLLKPVEFLTSLPNFDLVPERFSIYIKWHEFEQYISQVLTELNWDVYLNYKHTKTDRFQIDVIALNKILKTALFIECKHWKDLSKVYLSISRIIGDHVKRIEKYMRNCEWVCTKISKLRDMKYILPVIVILSDLSLKVYSGMPIVPIYKFIDFIVNIDSYVDALNLTLYKNKCYKGLD